MKNVMIVCQCATNKGDRAIAEYLINDLLQKDVSITLSATDPHLWENVKNKGVKVIGTGYQTFFGRPENKFFRKIDHEISNLYYSYLIYPDVALSRKSKRIEKISREYIDNLKKSDLVIVTGGHHITSIRNKNAMFSITYDIALASMYSKRYVLWSQTIGPLEFDDIKYKELFGNIIKKADAVYIRDKNSKRCIDELVGHNQKNVYKSYDSVFGFGNGEFIPYEKRNNKVGISIFNGLKKAYDTYPVLAEMLDSFAVKGNEIEFFRMENDESELNDIQSVISLMKTKAKIKIYPFMTETREHLKEISSCKYYIGYKTHSVIMSLTTATPLISVCYHEKTRDFMKDYSLEEYAIDDTELNSEIGLSLVDKVIENADNIHKTMAARSKEIACSIAMDFKEVL